MPRMAGTESVVPFLMSELWAAGPVQRWITSVISTHSSVPLLQGASETGDSILRALGLGQLAIGE